MPRPRLIHPIWVTVERLQREELLMDEDARAPVHGPRTTTAGTVTLPAQVSWGTFENPQPTELGAQESSDGYILCRPTDMDAYIGPGERLKRGDRITTMGHTTGLDVYITRQGPMGHYPDQNGSSLVRYYFEDRAPVKTDGNA